MSKKKIDLAHSNPQYMVGYGKPPKHSRFQPGRSGNPGGRPRKCQDFSGQIERELSLQVTMGEEAVRRRITQGELLARNMVQLAFQGHPEALKLLQPYLKDYFSLVKGEGEGDSIFAAIQAI